MIVVSIIAMLAVIAIPNYLRVRKRSQATEVLEDLRVIDSAIDQYALEFHKSSGDAVGWADVQMYVKNGSRLFTSGGIDIIGNAFQIPTVDTLPKVTDATFAALSDVAPRAFWSPYK